MKNSFIVDPSPHRLSFCVEGLLRHRSALGHQKYRAGTSALKLWNLPHLNKVRLSRRQADGVPRFEHRYRDGRRNKKWWRSCFTDKGAYSNDCA